MSDPYLGEIRLFGGYYAPLDWNFCDGSLLQIAEYDALYSLIGTTYGGDGTNTFGVPDLRGRLPVGQGTGPGLSPRTLAEQGGTETVTLVQNQMPQHSHSLIAQATAATTEVPTNAFFAEPQNGGVHYLDPTGLTPTDVTLAADSMQAAGGSMPHQNLMPGLAASYIIALQGIYPQRN